jgi:hypothetical protein
MVLRSFPRLVFMITLGTLSAVIFSTIAHDVFAATANDLGQVQKNIAKDAALIPRLIAVLAYVIATFFAITGLFKFKEWIEDSTKNSLNPAIFRLVVAALLIALPHVWVVVNTSLFGSKNGGTRSADVAVMRQNLSTFQKK